MSGIIGWISKEPFHKPLHCVQDKLRRRISVFGSLRNSLKRYSVPVEIPFDFVPQKLRNSGGQASLSLRMTFQSRNIGSISKQAYPEPFCSLRLLMIYSGDNYVR